MTVALVFVIAGLSFVSLAISIDLKRIADAVEAQNKHYGIGRPRPTIVNHDEAA